jgi:hypothetical protein
MRLFCFVVICSVSLTARSQFNWGHRFGLQTGIVLHIGTHVDAIGCQLNVFYKESFVQLNSGSTWSWNLKNYGHRRNFHEFRHAIGLHLLYGKKKLNPGFIVDPAFHNSNYNNSIGYQYIWYVDNTNTSQRSGAWSLNLRYFSMLLENDVFAGQMKDRFRTGHLRFDYRYLQFQFNFGLNIWTGETANSLWQRTQMNKCPSGFRILEDLPFGKTSHGLLYGGITCYAGLGQTIHIKTGIDSEHIRHAFQNRLTHDLLFLPKKIERNTPHYPRLDEGGCPVFNKEDVRKSKFYWQIGTNGY